MRLSNLLAAGAAIGAAVAEIPSGPFVVTAISAEGDLWTTNLATVSHGSVILSLSTGGTQEFTWNSETSRIVPTGQEYLHSSIGDLGYTLVFVTEDGPDFPSQVDGPLALLEVAEDEVYLVIPGNTEEKYQWNTYFSTGNLPVGFSRAEAGSPEANAALRITPIAN